MERREKANGVKAVFDMIRAYSVDDVIDMYYTVVDGTEIVVVTLGTATNPVDYVYDVTGDSAAAIMRMLVAKFLD